MIHSERSFRFTRYGYLYSYYYIFSFSKTNSAGGHIPPTYLPVLTLHYYLPPPSIRPKNFVKHFFSFIQLVSNNFTGFCFFLISFLINQKLRRKMVNLLTILTFKVFILKINLKFKKGKRDFFIRSFSTLRFKKKLLRTRGRNFSYCVKYK